MKTLTINIPNLDNGVAEKNAVIMANAFNERGYYVNVLLLQARGLLIHHLHSGIEIIDLKVKKKWMVFFNLLKYFLKHKSDGILSFMFPTIFWSAIACKFVSPRRRIVLTEGTTYLKRFFDKRDLNQFHQLLAVEGLSDDKKGAIDPGVCNISRNRKCALSYSWRGVRAAIFGKSRTIFWRET